MLKNITMMLIIVAAAAAAGIGLTQIAMPLLNPEPPIVEFGEYSRFFEQSGQPIVVFSSSTCPYCAKLRTLLNQQQVNYHEYVLDKSNDGHDLYKQLDSDSVPVLLAGLRRINGYSETDIIEAIGELANTSQ
ncbi:MAG: hypothetical protein HRT35_17560 [Algicola sp.]|nr:hypothetical protein [Algicola sp.]